LTVTVVHRKDCEQSGSWRLIRRSVGLGSFGVNLVELSPGRQIPEHDEVARDQEELFYAISGDATLVVDGGEFALPEGTFGRVDPAHRRTVRNDGDGPAEILIISAPRSSGYEPMEWA
jgi:uncharacterized cupin superfamily protein